MLVYDLGGGTADIALLRAVPDEPHRYEVLGQEGDEIGGTDWDERLCEFLAEQLTEQAMSENPALPRLLMPPDNAIKPPAMRCMI